MTPLQCGSGFRVLNINRLRQKRIELEQLISRFESGDEKYLGIKNTIKQEVESEVAIIDNYWTLL